MSRPKIFILLPVYNRRNITRKFIGCLKSQSYTNYHLVLIDDGSTDSTSDMVREEIPSSVIITGKGKWWWAGSLQQGYRWLRSNRCQPDHIVLIMNDDTEFEEDFLETGMSIVEGRPSTLLLAQCYSKKTRQFLEAGIHADWESMSFKPADDPGKVNCFSTMGLFFRVKDFEKIGGFHPRLLPHFTSDYEFTMRAHRKGFTLLTHSDLKLWLDQETTWNRDVNERHLIPLIRHLFSKKSPVNPLVWTSFVALACPVKWKVLNWGRVWMNTWFSIRRALKETPPGGAA